MVLEYNKKAYSKNLKRVNFDDGHRIKVKRSNPQYITFVCLKHPCTFLHKATITNGIAKEESELPHSCNIEVAEVKEEIEPFVIVKCPADLLLLQKSILKVDSTSTFIVEKNEDDVFKRCFVALSSWSNCFKYSRQIIQVDGTFMKSKPKLVLLAAIGIDGRGKIFPIAVGIVSCENSDNWTWFLSNLRAFFELKEILSGMVFVSDRDKGLLVGLNTVFPDKENFYCTRHLASNLKKSYKDKEAIAMFYLCVYAKDKLMFEENFNRMSLKFPVLHAELLALNPKHWAIAMCDRILYGYGCSNLVESFNGSIVEARKGSIVDCIDDVIVRYQEKFFKRSTIEVNSPNTITEWIILLMGSYKKNFSNYEHKLVANSTYYVITTERRYIVDLKSKHCSCLTTSQFDYPCSHLYFLIVILKLKLRDIVSPYYLIEELNKAYSINLPPFEYSSLDCPKESLLPPPELPSRGRPKTKRIRTNMDYKVSRAKRE